MIRLAAPRLTRVSVWRRRAVSAAVATLVAVVGSAPATAATNTSQVKSQQQQINKQISQLRGELNEVSSDYADLLGKLDDINNRKADVEAQITALQAKMDEVQRQLDDATIRLGQVQDEVNRAQAALDVAQTALVKSTKQLQDQAINAYVGRDPASDLNSIVFKMQDLRQVSAAGEYMQQVVSDRRTIVEQRRELQGQAEDLKVSLDAKRAEVQAAHDVIARQQGELQIQRSKLDGLRAEVQKQADQQQALLDEVEVKRESIQSQMDSLQHQSDSIAALLRQTGGGPGVAPGKGILSNPAPGYPMTSPFGMRFDPVMKRYQLHAGQDIGAPMGTAIHAAADGTVVSILPAASSGGYGNYTCINHGGGLATCYAHQSQFKVSAGQHVQRGQVIGLVGSTGFSTGPHLHFEVRVNGAPVNPIGYL